MTNIRDPQYLNRIAPDELSSYLLSQGWTEHEADEGSSLFLKDDSEVLVPRDRNLGDYFLRMSEALSTIAREEKRVPASVYVSVRSTGEDVIRIKLAGAETEHGTLPLASGKKLIGNAVNLIRAAAHSSERPEPKIGTVLKRATDFLRKARLGQTEQGSFILQIRIPIVGQLDADFDEGGDPIPYERKVSQTFMVALDSIRKAAEVAQPEQLIDNIASGVSADFCRAVAGLNGKGGNELEIKCTWSTKLAPMADVPTLVAISSEHYGFIRDGAKRLASMTPSEQVTIRGRVVELRRLQEGMPGHVAVRTDDGEFHFDLGAEQYQEAVAAHGNDSIVEVKGALVKTGDRKRLMGDIEIHQLEVHQG